MTLRRSLVAGLGPFGLALGCSPAPAPPAAQRATTGTTSPLHPLLPSDDATTTTQAPTTTTAATAPAKPQIDTGVAMGGNRPVTTVTIGGIPAPTRSGTTTTTFTVPEAATEDVGDVEWLVRQTFPETPDKAVRVAWCESTLNPAAVNGEHVGVMQIATKVHARRIAAMGYTVADLFGVRANLAVARAIYDDAGGWSPWTCA